MPESTATAAPSALRLVSEGKALRTSPRHRGNTAAASARSRCAALDGDTPVLNSPRASRLRLCRSVLPLHLARLAGAAADLRDSSGCQLGCVRGDRSEEHTSE